MAQEVSKNSELHNVKASTEVGVVADLHPKSAFPPFDPTTFTSQLFWLVVTFAFFYHVMSRIVLPRISSTLEMRRDRIAQDMDEANRFKNESDVVIAAYEQELASARSRAHTIGQEVRDKIHSEMNDERTQLTAQLSDKLANAEKQVDKARQKALLEMAFVAAETADTILTELIDLKIPHENLVEAVHFTTKLQAGTGDINHG